MDGVFMRKRIIICASLLLAALTMTAAALQQEQAALSEKLIRLHVVANSDSREDQQIKLQVRDAVLQITGALDREALISALPAIEAAAKTRLRELGREDAVTVTFGKERFPTRVYGNFALPAGVYQSLRVTIGEGEGQNWWCVAFPSLCFRATAAELKEAAVSAGFTDTEVKLITEEGGYVLKFKTLELLERLKSFLFA